VNAETYCSVLLLKFVYKLYFEFVCFVLFRKFSLVLQDVGQVIRPYTDLCRMWLRAIGEIRLWQTVSRSSLELWACRPRYAIHAWVKTWELAFLLRIVFDRVQPSASRLLSVCLLYSKDHTLLYALLRFLCSWLPKRTIRDFWGPSRVE